MKSFFYQGASVGFGTQAAHLLPPGEPSAGSARGLLLSHHCSEKMENADVQLYPKSKAGRISRVESKHHCIYKNSPG